jgi:hypothetical protein
VKLVVQTLIEPTERACEIVAVEFGIGENATLAWTYSSHVRMDSIWLRSHVEFAGHVRIDRVFFEASSSNTL